MTETTKGTKSLKDVKDKQWQDFEWSKWQNFRFKISLWLKKMRYVGFKRFYIMFGFWRRSRQSETELRLGIEYHVKKIYNEGLYSPNKLYVKKARSFTIYLIFPWLQIGLHGVTQLSTPKVVND